MSIVKWDKPKKAMSKEEWSSISADSAPPGVYTPNMSQKDRETWKGTIAGQRTGHLQVELRKTFGGAQMLIIVAEDGYSYKNHKPETTREFSYHVALNGGAQLTFNDFEELQVAVAEAWDKLKEVRAEKQSEAKRK